MCGAVPLKLFCLPWRLHQTSRRINTVAVQKPATLSMQTRILTYTHTHRHTHFLFSLSLANTYSHMHAFQIWMTLLFSRLLDRKNSIAHTQFLLASSIVFGNSYHTYFPVNCMWFESVFKVANVYWNLFFERIKLPTKRAKHQCRHIINLQRVFGLIFVVYLFHSLNLGALFSHFLCECRQILCCINFECCNICLLLFPNVSISADTSSTCGEWWCHELHMCESCHMPRVTYE